MNINHDTGLIDTILSLDTSTLPPLGGTAGVLTIVGTGALTIPSGTTVQQPSGVAGMVRFDSTTSKFMGYNGTSWSVLDLQGTVTSVAVTGSTGLTVGGSPITSSGTITLTLGTELQGLSGLATTGIIARTAGGTYSPRTITGTTGNITVTNGDGVAGNPTINLATLGTPVTASLVKITTDSFGRVSATAAVASGDITSALGYTPVNKAGDTITGTITMSGATITGVPSPTNGTDVANKNYVDAAITGLDFKPNVRLATVAALSANTAAGSGVGKTLTANAVGALSIDGVAAAANDRVLIKNETATANNGVYVVTNAGGAAATWVLTRATDADQNVEVTANEFMFVAEGNTLADTGWVLSTNDPITVDTTGLVYVQFSGSQLYTAGTGLTLTGNQFSLTAPVTVALGGTGLTSTPSNGQLDIGNGTGFTRTTLTAGTGISVTNGSGSITIANTGVTSIAGTANQITASASTGAITLSLPSAVTISTSLTVSGLTANSFLYSGTAGLLTTTTAPTNGQLLIGSTGAAPAAATLTAGAGISITNGAGSITIAATGGTGTVTSVAMTVPSILSVSGSPITTSGTLAVSLATQNANLVFAGPTTGGAAAPTFRSLVAADLPIQLYKENPSSPTAPSATGTNAVSIGTGSAASGVNATGIGKGTSASIWGSKAISNDSFATAGDSQTGIYQLRAITTNATATELFLDTAGTQRLIPVNNSVWTFVIYVAARRTDTTGGGAGYKFEGAIRKDTTSGSITLIGSVAKTLLGETNGVWDVAVTADTTNGSLKVSVTGEAAKTIRWVATVITTEVTN